MFSVVFGRKTVDKDTSDSCFKTVCADRMLTKQVYIALRPTLECLISSVFKWEGVRVVTIIKLLYVFSVFG